MQADLQLVHGFRCYDNIHVCKLIVYTYSTKREVSANACTRRMAGLFIGGMASDGEQNVVVVGDVYHRAGSTL